MIFLFSALVSWLVAGPLAFLYGIRTEILNVTRILGCFVVPAAGVLIQLFLSRNTDQAPLQKYRKFRIFHAVLAMLCFLIHSGVLYMVLDADGTGAHGDAGMYLFFASCLTGLIFSLPAGIYLLFTLNSPFHDAYRNAANRMLKSVSLIIFLTAFVCQSVSHFTLAYIPDFGEALGLALGIVIYFLGSFLGRKIAALPLQFVDRIIKKRKERAN